MGARLHRRSDTPQVHGKTRETRRQVGPGEKRRRNVQVSRRFSCEFHSLRDQEDDYLTAASPPLAKRMFRFMQNHEIEDAFSWRHSIFVSYPGAHNLLLQTVFILLSTQPLHRILIYRFNISGPDDSLYFPQYTTQHQTSFMSHKSS